MLKSGVTADFDRCACILSEKGGLSVVLYVVVARVLVTRCLAVLVHGDVR